MELRKIVTMGTWTRLLFEGMLASSQHKRGDWLCCKDKDAPEEMKLAKRLHIKWILRDIQDTENAKNAA